MVETPIPKQLLVASGVLVHKGDSGPSIYSNTGVIDIQTAAIRGVDAHLWGCLKIAADQLTLCLNVNSIDTGKHAKRSRHYEGRAVDINHIQRPQGAVQQATMGNPHARRLALYLLGSGFKVGEGGNWPAILFGPPHSAYNPTGVDHSTHMHVSLPRRPK